MDKLVKAVSGKNVKKHLKAFQAIASANDNTRVSGTRGFDASATTWPASCATPGTT